MAVVIDIKTGKAEPWSQLQTAAQSLLSSHDVEFEPEGHVFTHNGIVIPSITQILAAEGFIDTSHYDEWSRDRGSMIHLAVHYDITGELDESTLDPIIIPYFEAWRKFKDQSGFTVSQSEVPGINLTYNYAGIPDLIGCFPQPTRARRFVLELTKEATYKLIPHTDQHNFLVWQSACAVHHWKKNNLRR